jgi:hypothetical protein
MDWRGSIPVKGIDHVGAKMKQEKQMSTVLVS